MVLFTSIFVSRSDAASDAVLEVYSSLSPPMRTVPEPFTLFGIPLANRPSLLAVEVDQISCSLPANN
eukprot:15360299-Ditylum_brightwellii.AAC.1